MYSRVAAVLEKASIYKALESSGYLYPQGAEFEELAEFFYTKGLWMDLLKDASDEQVDMFNELYVELEAADLEYWTVKQWSDKYSQKIKKKAVETPAMGAIAIALALHGPTQLAADVARDIIYCKVNLPTPLLNGARNGNFDTISCCVIEGGDSVESLAAADYLAQAYTAKKAGIGITLDSRSQGDPVKNGAVEHLGKAPLYHAVEKLVKKFTQITRGGSATMTMKVIDPDIMQMMLWKTQRIDISQRIDKIDYSLAYNDAFVDAVLHDREWYLFSKYWAPEVHDNFHSKNYMKFVKEALAAGVPHKKVRALDVLSTFIDGRWETGRLYCFNVTRANEHTPFRRGRISQSNLCMEIALPTAPFETVASIQDVNATGEVAFCALSALNVAAIDLAEYFAVAERALRTIDKMIDLAPALSPKLEHDIRTRRSVGLGITGLASYLYNNGLDYDGSYESLVAVEELAATHYYAILQASQKLAAESGVSVEGIDPDWLPIDTMKPVTDVADWSLEYDWEALRGKPRKHSVLVAHMPCESSSAFSNSSNGLYPTRNRCIYKAARVGMVQFIVPGFTEDKTRVWDVDMVPYYQAIQNYSDQGISADYYTDFTKYPDMKIPEHEAVVWFVRQAKAGIKSSYYQNFRDTDRAAEAIEKADESCESGACKM